MQTVSGMSVVLMNGTKRGIRNSTVFIYYYHWLSKTFKLLEIACHEYSIKILFYLHFPSVIYFLMAPFPTECKTNPYDKILVRVNFLSDAQLQCIHIRSVEFYNVLQY